MRERTIFFPLFLIAAGGIWLLINMGQVPVENLWALVRIWPFRAQPTPTQLVGASPHCGRRAHDRRHRAGDPVRAAVGLEHTNVELCFFWRRRLTRFR